LEELLEFLPETIAFLSDKGILTDDAQRVNLKELFSDKEFVGIVTNELKEMDPNDSLVAPFLEAFLSGKTKCLAHLLDAKERVMFSVALKILKPYLTEILQEIGWETTSSAV